MFFLISFSYTHSKLLFEVLHWIMCVSSLKIQKLLITDQSFTENPCTWKLFEYAGLADVIQPIPKRKFSRNKIGVWNFFFLNESGSKIPKCGAKNTAPFCPCLKKPLCPSFKLLIYFKISQELEKCSEPSLV